MIVGVRSAVCLIHLMPETDTPEEAEGLLDVGHERTVETAVIT